MYERQYWWVTQGMTKGATIEQTLQDKAVVAPRNDKSGRAWFYWDNVSKIREGDVLFHYADGAIRAVSIATSDGQPQGPAQASRAVRERTSNGYPTKTRNTRDRDGREAREWRATVDALPLPRPLPIQTIGERLAALNLEKGPVNRNGGANPGFLYELTPEAVERIVEHMDLSDLPDAFTEVLADWKLDAHEPASSIDGLLTAFETAVARAHLSYAPSVIRRVLASLLAKRFIIFSGLSGSGKTRLAQALAHWITPDDTCQALVAVGPDWTTSENVIGYPDRLNGGYVHTPVLDLMLRARLNPDTPHVLILDEMNLSHVERYLADVLSAMESGEPLALHTLTAEIDGVPPALPFADNLFLIGTVNVDETTYVFSPKVLDRANVIEFQAGRTEMAAYLADAIRSSALDTIAHSGARYGQAFVAAARAESPVLDEASAQKVRGEVLTIFDVLATHNAEFGFRTAGDIMRFVAQYAALAGTSVGQKVITALPMRPDAGSGAGRDAEPDAALDALLDAALDAQIMQKVLPRLSGTRAQLAPVLWSLALMCRRDRPGTSDLVRLARDEREGDDPASAYQQGLAMRYPLSGAKLARMWTALERSGFGSFLDA